MINEKSLPVFPQRGISFLFSKQIAVFEICEECKDIVTSLGGVDLVLVGHGGGQLVKSLRRLHTLPQELTDGVEDNFPPVSSVKGCSPAAAAFVVSIHASYSLFRYSSAISRRT